MTLTSRSDLFADGLFLSVFRRSGDEIHPWPPNGDLRPKTATGETNSEKARLSGVLPALLMAKAGGAWDNAKKHLEKSNLGGKGSPVHSACVVGDTVGDPSKDTSGPSLNILIKLIAMVSSVLAPYL